MPQFQILNLADAPITPMKGDRGTQKRLINSDIGAEKVDVHLNCLDPREPGGRYHHHSNADNVYIVKKGEGQLVVDGTTYTIKEDDIIYIPAGEKHWHGAADGHDFAHVSLTRPDSKTEMFLPE